MHPFRVQCETCQSRLRVNDPAVVGQIHACPKCGGMVMLMPPAGWSPEGLTASDGADPKPSTPEPTALPSSPTDSIVINPGTAAELASSNDTANFAAVNDVGPELSDAALNEASPHDVSESPAGETPSNHGLSDPSELLEAGALHESVPPAGASPFTVGPAEIGSRSIALMVAGGGFALVLVIGLASLAMRLGEEPRPDEVAVAASPDAEEDVDSEAEANPANSDVLPAVDSAEAVVAMKPPAPPQLDAPPLPSTEELELPTDQPAESAPSEAADPTPVETDNPPEVATQPARASSFDPLDFDPLDLNAGSLDLILTRGGEQKPPEPADEPQPQDATDELVARVARVESDPAETVAELDGRLDDLADDARAVVRRGPTGLPPQGDIDDPLAVVIPEIRMADISLARAYRLLGDLAGTTITLDPAALRYAAIPADKKVSLRGENAAIGELLAQVGGPLNLEVVPASVGFITRRVGAEQRKAASYRVDDLLPPDAGDAEPLAELVKQMLVNLDAIVTPDGKKLRVDGSAAAHMDVAIFCERLRKVRRLKARSRYPSDMLRIEPALAALLPVLDRKTTFSFVDFTQLRDVLDHWRQTSGLEILVDWRSLADVNLTPTSTIACSVTSRPWREAFDSVLGGLELTWRPIDGGAIWVTTRQAAAAEHEVEFYPAPSREAAEAIEQLLTTSGASAVVYDQPSRTVIASATAAVHAATP